MRCVVKDPMAAAQGSESCPGALVFVGPAHRGRHCCNHGTIWFAWIDAGEGHRTHRRRYPLHALRRHGWRFMESAAPRERTQPLRPSSSLVSLRGRLSEQNRDQNEHSKIFRSVEKFIFPPSYHQKCRRKQTQSQPQTNPTLLLFLTFPPLLDDMRK